MLLSNKVKDLLLSSLGSPEARNELVSAIENSTTSEISLNTDHGKGTNAHSRKFLNIGINNGGSDITYTNDAAKGANFVIHTTGIYSMTYTDIVAGSLGVFSIAINGDTTLSPDSQAVGINAAMTTCIPGGYPSNCSATRHLNVGDVVNPIIDTDGGAAGLFNTFTITRLS